MKIGVFLVVWIIGCFIVPKAVRSFEAGYGVVTIASIIIWTLGMIAVYVTLK